MDEEQWVSLQHYIYMDMVVDPATMGENLHIIEYAIKHTIRRVREELEHEANVGR